MYSYALILNIKIAGSIISFNTKHLSRKKMRIINKENTNIEKHHPTVENATSQLDLPSLTPLFVAGCGLLQLGVPHWATSVDYCK